MPEKFSHTLSPIKIIKHSICLIKNKNWYVKFQRRDFAVSFNTSLGLDFIGRAYYWKIRLYILRIHIGVFYTRTCVVQQYLLVYIYFSTRDQFFSPARVAAPSGHASTPSFASSFEASRISLSLTATAPPLLS